MQDLPKTWVSSNNHLKILDQKNQKFQSCHGEQQKKHKTPNAKTEHGPCNQEEKKEANLKKH